MRSFIVLALATLLTIASSSWSQTPPEDTPTPTVVEDTPVDTPTASATASPTFALPPSGCAGDCNGDGQVTISEIVLGVNSALGNLDPSSCPAADTDGDGTVEISELIGAVISALEGCRIDVTPTHTATPDPTESAAPTESETPFRTPSATATATARDTSTVTSTPTVTATSTATPTVTLPPAAREVASLVEGASQVTLTTLEWLRTVRIATGVLAGTAQVTIPTCDDGSVTMSDCDTSQGDARLTLIFSECATQLPSGRRVIRNGALTYRVGDPEFCIAQQRPDGAVWQLEAGNFSHTEVDGATTVAALIADLTLSTTPGEERCDGRNRDETLDGSLTLACRPDAESIACATAGRRALELRGVGLRHASGGLPCERSTIARGEIMVTVDGGATNTYRLYGVTATRIGDGDAEVRLDGALEADCTGGLLLATDPGSPLRFASGGCPVAGEVNVRRIDRGALLSSADADDADAEAAEEAARETNRPRGVIGDQIGHSLFRSANGRVYQVVQNPRVDADFGADALQVTSLVGSPDVVGQCALGSSAVSPAVAVAAADGEPIPPPLVVKSQVILDATTPCFNRNASAGDGRVCVGPDCRGDCSCAPGTGCVAFSYTDGTALDQSAGGNDIPAAALVSSLPSVASLCEGFEGSAAYRFGPDGPSTQIGQCGVAPPDGFVLPGGPSQYGGDAGSSIVFAYDTSALTVFNTAVAGFPIDLDGIDRLNCMGVNRVLLNGVASAQSAPPARIQYDQSGLSFDFDGDANADKRRSDCTPVDDLCADRIAPDPERPCNAAVLGDMPVTGTTEGASGLGEAACNWGGGNDAPEAVFEFTAAVTGVYDITTSGSDFDTLLYVRDADCRGGEIACNDDAEPGLSTSAVAVALQSAQRVAIVVDGSSDRHGTYQLAIRLRRPDLKMESIIAPSAITGGQQFGVSLLVANEGRGAAGLVRARVQIGEQPPATFACTPALQPDTSIRCGPFPIGVPLTLRGLVDLSVTLDPLNEISEESELNNSLVSQIQVGNVLTFAEKVQGTTGLDLVQAVALDPLGAHLYAGGAGPNSLAVFDRDPITGTLHPATPSSITSSLSFVRSIAIDPSGRFVYAAGEDGAGADAVVTFVRAEDTGALTQMSVVRDGEGGVDGLDFVQSIALDRDGANLYAAGANDDAVAVFARDDATGALTFLEVHRDGVDGVDGLNFAQAVTVSGDGNNVYAAGGGDDALAVFARQAGGRLSFVEVQRDGVGSVDGLAFARAVVLAPNDEYVYAAGAADNAISVFQRLPQGGLKILQVQRDGVGGIDGLLGVAALAVGRSDGNDLYAAGSSDNAVAVFRRGSTSGQLSYVEVQQDGIAGVDGIAFAQGIAVSPDGRHLYVAGAGDDAVAVFTIE